MLVAAGQEHIASTKNGQATIHGYGTAAEHYLAEFREYERPA